VDTALPAIPAKRYFTIGEVSELCQVKPYVLRYWEQEFTQLKPMKRRGNRRYYQHHEVLLIRRIRALLYEHGFTISGARNRLADAGLAGRQSTALAQTGADLEGAAADMDDAAADATEEVVVGLPLPAFRHQDAEVTEVKREGSETHEALAGPASARPSAEITERSILRAELLSIRELLTA